MLALLSLTLLLTVPLPLSAHEPIDCSKVAWSLVKCPFGSYIPEGKCCPICKPDCSKVACPLVHCPFGSYIPEGKCCPICIPDCSKVPCPLVYCPFGSYIPDGSCCPICKPDCSKVPCPLVHCPFGSYMPEGNCCPICKPDCSKVACPLVHCPFGSYIPEGKCCPICNPDCSKVACPAIHCPFGSYIPEGKCCKICKPDCSKVACPLVKCPFGSYLPEGKCCPICKPGTCPNGQNGTCGSIAGNICPDGTECMFKGNYPDASGKCCIKKPKPITVSCLLPKEIGPCNALVKRYYFDKIECKCKMFNYGGCQGNSNNFPTLKKCKQSCRDTSCPVCNLQADTGPCRGAFKRFFYNTRTCQCEEFIYGGCKGNGNRYETKEECEKKCGSYPCVKRCFEPKKVGPCKALIKRFYYNPLKNKCEKFTWGGCQANGNNFKSKKLCNKICKDAVCSLPVKVGPCKALKKRYYYNSKTKECEVFYWGGCESNGNNFKSAKACKKACN